MSNKQSRPTASPSPTSSSLHHSTSKLPKFLQKQSSRDKSKSRTDLNGSPSTSSSASTSPEIPSTPSTSKQSRKSSKFLGIKDKEEKSRLSSETTSDSNSHGHNTTTEMDEPPVIVEPVSIPRPRTRSERPISSAPDMNVLYSSTSSTSRIGDLPTRLSGWFTQTFSSSNTDLSLPNLLAQSSQSPISKSKGASALLTAAKHGKGHLDKAMRYLLDSDATPDKCTDPIWLLGVQHPGYEPPPPSPSPPPQHLSTPAGRRTSGSPPSFRSSTSSVSSSYDAALSQSSGSTKHPNPAANWPPVFYLDFTSRVWLTYRSQFSVPIRDTRLADLCGDPATVMETANSPTTVKSRPWNWMGEKTWTSDSGWGCMLRTGQSLLANALVHSHLGRDWRRPPYPVHTADYATYVQIVTWFLDTPSPEAPFSVHRMALAGKELGTDVGQWFGPSTAAGAIKTLVHAFPEAEMGVSVANDGVLYQSDVYSASHGESTRLPRKHGKIQTWGHQPVLLLLGIRLGIDGVNPIYYETIKLLYTFPQSVGIAGGRPSSSYYFVGSQADNLFYLDPHHARPAIPLRSPPQRSMHQHRGSTPDSDWESSHVLKPKHRRPSGSQSHFSQQQHQRIPTSPSSTRTGSSTFSYHAPLSPSPLQQQFSSSSADSSKSNNSSWSPPPSTSQHGGPGRWRSASASASVTPDVSSDVDHHGMASLGINTTHGDKVKSSTGLDSVQEHYVTAYSAAELKTFHCERVRKMPMSGLDPSMLIGFLCRDEADWRDFRRRVGELPRTIFSVQDEPPNWPSDSDDNMGLESISEPDDLDMDMGSDEEADVIGDDDREGDNDGDVEGDQFFETRSASVSSIGASQQGEGEKGSDGDGNGDADVDVDVDTEEDPVDPVTPGPHSKFDIGERKRISKRDVSGKEVDFGNEENIEGFEDDIEDDWVDPSLPSPSTSGPSQIHSLSQPQPQEADASPIPAPVPEESTRIVPPPPIAKTKSNGSTKKGKKVKKQVPVPVPMVRLVSPQGGETEQEHYPFPVAPTEDRENSSPSPPVMHERTRSQSIKGKRMHTARARDGGRTQSGGVKGILTED